MYIDVAMEIYNINIFICKNTKPFFYTDIVIHLWGPSFIWGPFRLPLIEGEVVQNE